MCHPAVILLSSQVSLLPSQEIKGVTVWFQLGSSPQSSLCPFPRVAGGVQLFAEREGFHAWAGCTGSSLGAQSQEPIQGSCARAEPIPGSAAPAGAFPGLLPLLSSPSQLPGLSCEFPLGETSPCFIWEIIKMKRGDFTPRSVVDLEEIEMTAAVLC